MYIAQGQRQITPKILMVTKYFYYLNHTMQVSAISLINFEKMIFQLFPRTNVWECKFDLAVKMSTLFLDHHLNKFSRPGVLYAIYQDSAIQLSWFWRSRF